MKKKTDFYMTDINQLPIMIGALIVLGDLESGKLKDVAYRETKQNARWN